MIVHDAPQGSDEWIQSRLGVITASMVHTIVKWDKGTKGRRKDKSDARPAGWVEAKGDAYLNTLVVESILGVPADEASGGWMDRGNQLEGEARDWLALELDVDVAEIGFITTDCGRFGCSLDGDIAGVATAEIKCRNAVNHVRCLRDPEAFDAEIQMQVQMGFWVTGRTNGYGVAYNPSPRLKNMIREYEPDPEIQAAFDVHLPAFRDRLDAAIALVEEPEDFTDPISGWR